tara:strand:- start:124 stop:366 length:243 start_codon:yes stop_codon:yes gene_type:complete
MPIINPWTAMAAGKAVWTGYKWVKQMKKLKKAGGSAVKQIQSGTKPASKSKVTKKKQTFWKDEATRKKIYPKKYWERIDK